MHKRFKNSTRETWSDIKTLKHFDSMCTNRRFPEKRCCPLPLGWPNSLEVPIFWCNLTRLLLINFFCGDCSVILTFCSFVIIIFLFHLSFGGWREKEFLSPIEISFVNQLSDFNDQIHSYRHKWVYRKTQRKACKLSASEGCGKRRGGSVRREVFFLFLSVNFYHVKMGETTRQRHERKKLRGKVLPLFISSVFSFCMCLPFRHSFLHSFIT